MRPLQMDSLSASNPPFERLLVVRLSAMGDIIHTMPAVAALRAVYPRVTIGWVIEERWAELLCTLRHPRSGLRSAQRPLVDRIHTVNTPEWRRSLFSLNTWQQMAAGLSYLRGVEYQAAIDFQGAVRSALLARWSGANVIFGDAQPRENAASMWYTRPIITSGVHVIEQALSLARAAVQPLPCVPRLEFPVDPEAENKIAQMAGAGAFALLNPGAGWGAKQWPPERYGIVASELAKNGLRSIVNYGPGEQRLAMDVEAASEGAARPMSCSISELISLTRRARLFIGGDTGPMHLAAALQIPVVGLFGPTNPARNGPFGVASVVLRSASSLTSHARHSEPEPGLLEITVEDVVTAARQLLARSG
jgi:heptosyltransferase I